MIDVPETLVRIRTRISGDKGEAWLRSLPGIFAELMQRWSLVRDGEPMHGAVGLVLPVRRDDERFVLKVGFPEWENKHEAVALERWHGDGAVKLFEFDPRVHAFLLERADSTRDLTSIPSIEGIAVAAQLLRRHGVGRIAGPPSMADILDNLTVTLPRMQRESDGVVPRRAMDFAMECIESYVPVGEEVLVNTDLHYDNVLASEREPWLVIDPKIMNGPLEYGVAPLLWTLPAQTLSSSLLEHFDVAVAEAGLDAEATRRWSIVRAIECWLWSWRAGLTDDPIKCKHIVETLMRSAGGIE